MSDRISLRVRTCERRNIGVELPVYSRHIDDQTCTTTHRRLDRVGGKWRMVTFTSRYRDEQLSFEVFTGDCEDDLLGIMENEVDVDMALGCGVRASNEAAFDETLERMLGWLADNGVRIDGRFE